VDAPSGRPRLKIHLASRPFPHFEPSMDRPGFIVKVDEDGTRTVGGFIKRVFRPISGE